MTSLRRSLAALFRRLRSSLHRPQDRRGYAISIIAGAAGAPLVVAGTPLTFAVFVGYALLVGFLLFDWEGSE